MTARLTADAVDAVLRSGKPNYVQLAELRAMVETARRLDRPPLSPAHDAGSWPILTPASGVIPTPYGDERPYDPRD